MSARWLLLAVLLCGCEPFPEPAPVATAPPRPEITVTRVQHILPMPARGGNGRAALAAMSEFMGGRMDALHAAVPYGRAGDALVEQMVLAGVRPRKIRRGGGPGAVTAERYLASVPSCPGLDLIGATFGSNRQPPGFGCASLANVAADAADPADLLGNAAVERSDPERAAAPVARYRGFAPPAAPASPGPSAVVSPTR